MKVRKLGSATISIETHDVKLLCDPWLVDGAYYGSWCNYPPINLEDYAFDDIDYVYISHIHPDHFDQKTMKFVDKDTPILIHEYHQKFLKRNIESLGYQVIELENGIPFSLSTETTLSIFAADNCDPTICGHLFGCVTPDIKGSMQLDSICVVDDGSHVLVNTNDSPFGIAKRALSTIKTKYPVIHFAAVGYTSASLFPHCMMDYDGLQMSQAISKAKMHGLNSALSTLNELKPEAFMLFAGTYIIGGFEYRKNSKLPLPELQDAVEYINEELCSKGLNSQPVMLNYNEFYDLRKKSASAVYVPTDPVARADYIKNVARWFKYDFEDDSMPSDNEVLELLQKSMPRFTRKLNELHFRDNLNLIFDLPSGNFAKINTHDQTVKEIYALESLSSWHRFRLDPRLLIRVLSGPRYANWNNIEIGALLDFSRKPDVYRMDVHIMLNYLHI